MKASENILIIGAGLCGSLLALRLAQRGHKIRLMEKRPDLRKAELTAGRSINLAFSDRGAKAMKMAGIEDKVEQLCIPMQGRMIHEKDGNTFLSRYSGLESEYINSISRPGLNALLLDEAEKMENVEIRFGMACTDVDLENATASFADASSRKTTIASADVIFGTDGAGSVVRQSLFFKRDLLFDYSQKWLHHGYKELHIPADENGRHQLFKNALHIWPRGENMIIALPNQDGSFTVTLFLSFKDGKYNFDQLDSVENVEAYFKSQFPDAHTLMPDLGKLFFDNPTNPLGTVRCSPWHYKGNTLILGDAAHAVVPFYGQGMNASFEDVTVLDGVLNENHRTWEDLFEAFEARRKRDADAIGDLSMDNFEEMKANTASPLFQQKRKLETAFELEHPDRYSAKYRLVAFQEDIGYHEAMTRGRAQDKAMLKLIAENKIPEKLSLLEKIELVNKATEEILREENSLF